MVLKRKPSHVPDWVWDEYQQVMRMHDLHLFNVAKTACPDLTDDDRDIPARIVKDPECASVWSAIDRRKSKAVNLPSNRHAMFLFGFAKNAFMGPSEAEKLSGAKRAMLGKEIATLVTDLQEKLTALRGLGEVPPEIQHEVTSALQRSYGYYRPVRINPDQQGKQDDLRESLFALALGGVARHAFFDDDDTVNVLAALSRGAKAWAVTTPLQYRASDGAHVYFAKAMGLYLERNYGAPLHGQVACLTNCLYGTSLDDKNVQKLRKG